jgi:hypothetical protein
MAFHRGGEKLSHVDGACATIAIEMTSASLNSSLALDFFR